MKSILIIILVIMLAFAVHVMVLSNQPGDQPAEPETVRQDSNFEWVTE